MEDISIHFFYSNPIDDLNVKVLDKSYISYFTLSINKLTSTPRNQIFILSFVFAFLATMVTSALGIQGNYDLAFAGGNDHDDDDSNIASQIIAQVQRSVQNSQVVSGGDTVNSGNNFNFQNQENSGNNALGQQ